MRLIVTLLVALTLGLAQWPAEAQRVALHATQQEIDIWKQRRLSGPYLSDWNRILGRADSFLSNPRGTWVGNQLDVAWNAQQVLNCDPAMGNNYFPGGSPSDCNGDRTYGDHLRDAGFVYLVTGTTSYRDAVRTVLLDQADNSGTDFTNTSKWNVNTEQLFQENYAIANWLRKLAYGYSYIRHSLSGADQATIDAFFNQAATYWSNVVDRLQLVRWSNRMSFDDPSEYPTPCCTEADLGITHFGGYQGRSYHHSMSNGGATQMATVAAVAVITNNATLKAKAKRYYKEWLTFAVGADGTVFDQARWNNTSPGAQGGFGYEGTTIGSMLSIADHLARDGDTELMTYSTSAGASGWTGGPKSTLKVMQHYAGLVIAERGLSGGGGVTQYASDTSTTSTSLRIGPGTTHVNDVSLIPANLYHKDAAVTRAYTRTMPSSTVSGGYDPWGGDWGTYPGLRFMFGQLENVVNPYSSAPDIPPDPDPAADITVSVSSGSDNAEQSISTGTTVVSPTNLELVETQLGGFRFVGIPVPKNATCDTAVVRFTGAATIANVGTPTYSIKAEDSIAAPTFVGGSANNNISGRTLDTPAVSWSPADWTANTANAASTTPDLCTIFQPFFNDASWSPTSNAVALVIANTVNGQRRVKPINEGGTITLFLTYTAASSGSPTRTVTNWRFGLKDFREDVLVWFKGANVDAALPAGACVQVRLQITVASGDFGPEAYKFIWREDGGAWEALVPDSTKNLYMDTDRTKRHRDATTNSFDAASFVEGLYILAPGDNPGAVALTDGQSTDYVTNVCIKNGVAEATLLELSMALSDGTPLTDANPAAITVDDSSGFAYVR